MWKRFILRLFTEWCSRRVGRVACHSRTDGERKPVNSVNFKTVGTTRLWSMEWDYWQESMGVHVKRQRRRYIVIVFWYKRRLLLTSRFFDPTNHYRHSEWDLCHLSVSQAHQPAASLSSWWWWETAQGLNWLYRKSEARPASMLG